MPKICIIGLGQIGGSLGKALKALGNKYYIVGIDNNTDTLNAALKIGAADEVSLNIMAAKGNDIIVISTPVDSVVPIYKNILNIANNAIITDTGSVKEKIEKEVKAIAKKGNFVFGHPMAGKEKNGINSADSGLFCGANIVITGSFNKSLKNESIIEEMWEDAGGNIIKMLSKKHDEFVALTSHLPHLMAFSLNSIYKDSRKKNKEIDNIVAGSFSSAVRVANSSADMWAPVLEANGANIKKHLKSFIKELKVFEKSLNDKKKIKKVILKTQK